MILKRQAICPTPSLWEGRIDELADAARSAGMRSKLVVTDPNLVKLPMFLDAVEDLHADALEPNVFSDVQANPVVANVDAGVAALRSGDNDGVIAFMSGQTRPIWDFEDIGDWWTRADPDGIVPIVAVPKTASTGSEVGRAGIITDEETHTKRVIFHPKMMPQVTIGDPALTAGMPRLIMAGNAMEAFAQLDVPACVGLYRNAWSGAI